MLCSVAPDLGSPSVSAQLVKEALRASLTKSFFDKLQTVKNFRFEARELSSGGA